MLKFILALAIYWLTWLTFINNCTGHFIAIDQIQAEDYTEAFYFDVLNDCSADPNVTYAAATCCHGNYYYLTYAQVEFGERVDTLTMRWSYYDSHYTSASVSFRLDSSDGPVFLSFTLNNTGADNNCDFVTNELFFGAPLTGMHELYIGFNLPDAGLYLDWLIFSNSATRLATEKTEAEDYNSQQSINIYNDCPDSNVYYVEANTNISSLHYQLDFGSGVQMVTLRLSNVYSISTLYVSLHLDSSDNPPIVTISVGQTGSQFCDFFTVDVFLDNKPSGVHDLIFTFPGQISSALRLDWFIFNQNVVPN